MGTSERLGNDGGIDNPEIRDGTVDNPDLRQGIEDPEIRAGVDNPEIKPGSASGIVVNWKPLAIGALGLGVVVVAAFSFMQPDSSVTPGTSLVPGATQGVVGPAAEETATLVVSGVDVSGSWTLDGISGDVSPTATLIAAVWTETVDNVAAGYGDLITVSMGGPIVEGTQSTSAEGVSLGFAISRMDASGTELSSHVFSSRAGECQVTMARTTNGVAGTFTCTGVKDKDGHSADATGSFAT